MSNTEFCPKFNFIVWKQQSQNSIVMTRLRCKSWQCDHCAKINRDMWRSHLKKRISKLGGDWWFITLTAHENIRTPAGSLDNIRKNLDRLFKRVKRVWGKIEYVRVYEKHIKGAFHVHIIMSGLSARVRRFYARNRQVHYKPVDTETGKGTWGVQTWFKRNCREIGLGYMVQAVWLESTTKTVNYICKYLTKACQDFYERYLRRIQTSQGIGSPFERGSGDWNVVTSIWRGMLGDCELTDLNLKMTIPKSYWHDNIVYPKRD